MVILHDCSIQATAPIERRGVRIQPATINGVRKDCQIAQPQWAASVTTLSDGRGNPVRVRLTPRKDGDFPQTVLRQRLSHAAQRQFSTRENGYDKPVLYPGRSAVWWKSFKAYAALPHQFKQVAYSNPGPGSVSGDAP